MILTPIGHLESHKKGIHEAHEVSQKHKDWFDENDKEM